MSTTRIYMNHFIREEKPTEPVIALLRSGKRAYADEVIIYDDRGKVVARIVTGNMKGIKGCAHDVKCYVETDQRVEVL